MLILCYVGVPIRDLAGLAGVSAPPELWKVLTSSLPANSSALASNSSSTVITRFDFFFSFFPITSLMRVWVRFCVVLLNIYMFDQL